MADLERAGHFQAAAVTSSTPAGNQLPLTLLALAQGTNLVTIGTTVGQVSTSADHKHPAGHPAALRSICNTTSPLLAFGNLPEKWGKWWEVTSFRH